MKRRLLNTHCSSRRDAAWFLEQDDSGQIYVRYENSDDPSDDWRKTLSEFLAQGTGLGAKAELQRLIDRMFDADRPA